MARLTEQQKKFCDNYIQTGNAAQSYIDAGYKARGEVARACSSRLLTNANVVQYIQQRNKAIERATIATMTEVKEFWTNTLRDTDIDLRERLKASEFIAKTNGAFLDRLEHSGETDVNIKVTLTDD